MIVPESVSTSVHAAASMPGGVGEPVSCGSGVRSGGATAGSDAVAAPVEGFDGAASGFGSAVGASVTGLAAGLAAGGAVGDVAAVVVVAAVGVVAANVAIEKPANNVGRTNANQRARKAFNNCLEYIAM